MIRLSHSARRTFHGCPRQFMLRSRFPRPYVPLQSSEIGKAFHKLMELSFRSPLPDVLTHFQTWSNAMQSDCPDTERRENIRVWHLKGQALWRGYLTHMRQLKPRVCRVLDTEHRFLTEISEVYVPGVIDQIALVENPWFGSDYKFAVKPDLREILAIGDYKTTSLDVDVFEQSLLKSEQAATYLIWSRTKEFQELYPECVDAYGLPVAVFFDIISTPKIKLKKSESEEEFLDRYERTVTLSEEAVTRRVLFPSDQSLYDTVRSFETDRRDIETARATGFWRRGESSCIFFGEMCPWSAECEQCTEGLLDPPSPPKLFQIEVSQDGFEDQTDE